MIGSFITVLVPFMFALSAQPNRIPHDRAGEIDGIWAECQGPNATLESSRKIEQLFDRVSLAKLNTVFIQVYRGNKAWYRSSKADNSPYRDFFAREKNDPLNLAIYLSHKAGIELHAWVNVFRIWKNRDAKAVKKLGTSVITRDGTGRSLADYRRRSLPDDGVWLDPGDPRARDYLLGIIGEILQRYPDIDGIHLDYVRYPYNEGSKADFGYGEASVSAFKKKHGFDPAGCNGKKRLLWDEWRRDQLTTFIKDVRAETARKGKKLSVAVLADKRKSRSDAFQDWPRWLKESLVDFVVPMNYSASRGLVKKRTKEILDMATDRKKVLMGLGAYKMLDCPQDILSQVRDCRALDTGGVVLFSYDNMCKKPELFSYLGKHMFK